MHQKREGGILDGQPRGDASTATSGSHSWVDVFKPSLFSRRSAPRKQLGPTAWLDGLRGFAAFLVYWHHHHLWARDNQHIDKVLENAFGYEGNHYFITLPFVRHFFSGGHFAVSIFFVISGYVLSAKPLSLIQAGEFEKFGDNIASALFRRWARLWIPVLAVTFIYMTMWHAFGIWIDLDQEDTYREELWKWYTSFKNYTFIFTTGGPGWLSYNPHCWSIVVEMKGSIAVYTTLMAISRARRNARLLLEAGLIFYFMYIADGAHYAMFTGGMLLCDLDLLAKNNHLPQFFSIFESYKESILVGSFVVSMYLGGSPSHDRNFEVLQNSPGWYFLSFFVPQAVFDYKWFFLFWAAMLFVACVPRMPWLKAFFETRFTQYMGHISFGFYLVHGPILFAFADKFYAAVGFVRGSHEEHIPQWVNRFPLPITGPLGFEIGFLVPALLCLPLTMWVAEIVTKGIDTPTVKMLQRLYRSTL
jgi:peptidoglycan/LPS O-acetylase OafA/YrhL